MERTAVNPWDWSISYGYNQCEVVSGQTRTLFCAGQTAAGTTGCFGSQRVGQACTSITENGAPAGQVMSGVFTDATLASVFCIPATGSALIDGTAALPGPGATSLPGTFIAR